MDWITVIPDDFVVAEAGPASADILRVVLMKTVIALSIVVMMEPQTIVMTTTRTSTRALKRCAAMDAITTVMVVEMRDAKRLKMLVLRPRIRVLRRLTRGR